MRHTCDIHATYMRHTFDIHATYMRHTCDIHATYMRHTCDIHATYMRHTCDIHATSESDRFVTCQGLSADYMPTILSASCGNPRVPAALRVPGGGNFGQGLRCAHRPPPAAALDPAALAQCGGHSPRETTSEPSAG